MPSGNGRKGKRLAGKPLHHFYICCNKNQEAAIRASRCTSSIQKMMQPKTTVRNNFLTVIQFHSL